jgi:hypothetical protein
MYGFDLFLFSVISKFLRTEFSVLFLPCKYSVAATIFKTFVIILLTRHIRELFFSLSYFRFLFFLPHLILYHQTNKYISFRTQYIVDIFYLGLIIWIVISVWREGYFFCPFLLSRSFIEQFKVGFERAINCNKDNHCQTRRHNKEKKEDKTKTLSVFLSFFC